MGALIGDKLGNINLLIANIPEITSNKLDFIGKFIAWMADGLGSIGWAVVIFAFLLKVITLPLDIYSRISMKKNQLKMKKMQPELERLKKVYKNDNMAYQRKYSELQKKEGYSVFGACLPTLVTLIFFIFVFSSFNQYTVYQNIKVYNSLVETHNTFVLENGLEEATEYTPEQKEELQKLLQITFDKENEGFLWVKNIWIADNPMEKLIPSHGSFESAISRSSCACSCKQNKRPIDTGHYNLLMGGLESGPNGYFIIPILTIAVTILSQILNSKANKQQLEMQGGQSAMTGKMMMWIMPIMIGVFSVFYSTAFAIYMLVNSVTSTSTTIIINKIVEKKFKKEEEKEQVNSYRRKGM